jgi:hypothetical protein
MRNCPDAQVRSFWEQFGALGKRQRDHQSASTLNKMHVLSRSLPLRFALGQPTSTIDFRKLLANRITLVVDLSDTGMSPPPSWARSSSTPSGR